MYGKTRERRTGCGQFKRVQHSRTPVQPRPKGVTPRSQCGVASLAKGPPLPAGRALPWLLGVTLMVYSSAGQDTSVLLSNAGYAPAMQY